MVKKGSIQKDSYDEGFSPNMKINRNKESCIGKHCINELQNIFRLFNILDQQQQLFYKLYEFKISLSDFTKQYRFLQKQLSKDDVNNLRNFGGDIGLLKEHARPVIKCAVDNCDSELKTWLINSIDDLLAYTKDSTNSYLKLRNKELKKTKIEFNKKLTVNSVLNYLFDNVRTLNHPQFLHFFNLDKK